MLTNFIQGLSDIPPINLAIFSTLIVLLLYGLPSLIRKTGLKKLGPIELEHNNQMTNYAVIKHIEEIDVENREALWDMTEDLFLQVALRSTVSCAAAVGHIIDGIASPIRNMVLLNHIAPKLCKEHESLLLKKIEHGITRALRDVKLYENIENCPVVDSIRSLHTDKYKVFIDEWIASARSITAMACAKKIRVYNDTLTTIHDKYWREVYMSCIEKNNHYICDMGYALNKSGEVYKL